MKDHEIDPKLIIHRDPEMRKYEGGSEYLALALLPIIILLYTISLL